MIGVMQGRLTEPVDGLMQEFPRNWKLEFEHAKKIGLHHIDWIITDNSFDNNPLFKENVKDFSINSVCADVMINELFYYKKFLDLKLNPICEFSIKNNIRSITIPLLEKSSVVDHEIRKRFKEYICFFGEKYKDLIFSFEFEANVCQIKDVINLRENFKLTYDTGNITSFTKSKCAHKQYISDLFYKIDNVHLKDRTIDAKTVYPLSGDTDFSLIFKELKERKYDGVFTIQTARGKTGNEFDTIKKHVDLFKDIWEKT